MSNFKNSIWPNSDGNLGKIKVQIPDGVTTQWPDGDALVGDFVYKDGKLVGFVDSRALVINDEKTSTIPYDYAKLNLPSIFKGTMTFQSGERNKTLIDSCEEDAGIFVTPLLKELLGNVKFKAEHIKSENKLVLHIERVDDDTLTNTSTFLTQNLPQNIEIDLQRDFGYTYVEWIGDTSSSQYILIDEPYTNGSSGIYVRGSFITEQSISVLWHLNTSTNPGSSCSPAIGYGYSDDPCAFTFGRYYAGANHGSGGTYVFGEVAEFWANWLNNNKMEAKLGENYMSVSDPNIRKNPFTWDKQPLLARLVMTDPEIYPNSSRKRIYEVKMSQGEQETRHLLPILDELGNPGLYDRVQKRAYFNNGTGKLDYGLKYNTTTVAEESVVYSWRQPVEYGQLTERGLRRIYKVPEGCNMTEDEYAEANGFKVLVETPMPEEGYWRPEWRETEEEIILDWIETEAPVDESFQD